MGSRSTSFLYVFAPVHGEPQLAGRLDWRDGRGRFAYAPDWLANEHAYALDPRNLPLKTGPFDTTHNGGCTVCLPTPGQTGGAAS